MERSEGCIHSKGSKLVNAESRTFRSKNDGENNR